ncbi:MAG: hypothetical protein OEY44_01510, partial [Candidatus Peregrinibacteria bacterium]|nr:hypothetical protein [Candidatus Peregrinibacteria bacterium]
NPQPADRASAPATQEHSGPKCPSCSQPILRGGRRFCSNCGGVLPEASTQSEVQEQEVRKAPKRRDHLFDN